MRKAAFIFALALVAGSVAAPAQARWHGGYHNGHHNDGVDAGDVVAGVAIVGGLAAIFSAIGQGNRARQDAAVDTCAQEAEFRTHGRLSQITNVAKRNGYFTVNGLLDMENGPGPSFTCTVRNGRIYGMQLSGDPGPPPPPGAMLPPGCTATAAAGELTRRS